MTFQSQLDSLSTGRPSAVTVGTFDGVHVGHRKLLAETVARASSLNGGVAAAIVFRQQPRALLVPDRPVTYLSPLEDRLAMIRAAGIDLVIPVEFDESLRSLSPREFAGELAARVVMKHLILGPGAVIGRDRSGTPDVLRGLGTDLGFQVHTIQPAIHAGHQVSSSAIRRALADGEIGDACAMLGRPYLLTGVVETGDRRGRQLGFPTANLGVDPRMALPGDGIYATWALVAPGTPAARRHPSATSIGVRPTFGGGKRTIEAHLLDFDGDLYGANLGIEFVERLRPELKFESVDALVRQMTDDVRQARSLLRAGAGQAQDRTHGV